MSRSAHILSRSSSIWFEKRTSVGTGKKGDQKEIFGHLLFYGASLVRGYALEEDSAPRAKARSAPAPVIRETIFLILCAMAIAANSASTYCFPQLLVADAAPVHLALENLLRLRQHGFHLLVKLVHKRLIFTKIKK